MAFCVAPDSGRVESLAEAVLAGGGQLVDLADARVIVWADPARADEVGRFVERAPGVEWVALPFAGIEPYVPVIRSRPDITWTCARDVYSRPVAEHAIALATAGLRNIGGYARQTGWTDQVGSMLVDGRVTIFGGGGIAREIISLLQGWKCDVTIVRRSGDPVEGASRVLPPNRGLESLAGADAVILALPLTEETRRLADQSFFGAMESHSWLINVARGGVVDTDALVQALVEGSIGGAALDVTDPEPLPDGHRLWSLENAIITPHVGNTPEMGIPLLAEFMRRNVGHWLSGRAVEGIVDPIAGY